MRGSGRPIRFEYYGGHLIAVPVELSSGLRSRFILDTGAGLPVISPALAERAGVRATGQRQTGRRMSGQELSLPIVILPTLTLGRETFAEVAAGLFDLDRFLPAAAGIGGMLGLPLFESTPFVIDHAARRLRLGERLPPTAPRAPLALRREGLSLDAFVDLELPDGSVARVELDTGSDSLILHHRYQEALGISPQDPRVHLVEGIDETGHAYVRYHAHLAAPVRIRGAPQVERSDLEVIFSDIIYDGLLGHSFLRPFAVGVDLPSSEIAFGPGRARDRSARTSAS